MYCTFPIQLKLIELEFSSIYFLIFYTVKFLLLKNSYRLNDYPTYPGKKMFLFRPYDKYFISNNASMCKQFN